MSSEKPRLVLLGLAEQEQASFECFLERNYVALREIFAWCVPFLKKKVLPFGYSPRASCCLAQGAWGSFLKILLILRWKAPRLPCWKELWFSCVRVLFVEKSSDIAISRFFLSCGLEVVCPEEVFWVRCAFFKGKSALTECSPRASCYLEKS